MSINRTSFLITVLSLSVASMCACKNTGSRSDLPLNNIESVGNESDSLNEIHPHFVEQGIEDIESPFTKETVLELNEIVGRSLSAIREFDQARLSVIDTSGETLGQLLNEYLQLSARAVLAKSDMQAATQNLISSGEQYNEEILAAMVHFVTQVDNEIRVEVDKLSRVR